MSVNLCVFVGNMTDDPGRRYTPNNVTIATFGLAVNKAGRRDERDKPLFVDVECWDKLAEQVYDNGRRGRKVYVQGELVRDEWEDKDTGKPRYKYYLKAFVVRWLDSRGNDDDRGRGDDRGRERDDRDRGRDRGRDDRDRGRRDERDDRRPSRRDEEPRSRSTRDDEPPPPSDSRGSGRTTRDEDLPF